MANRKGNLREIESGRGIFAYECVQKIVKKDSIAKEYKSYSKRIPMMIQNNGLGPSLAFVYAKGKVGNDELKGDKNAYYYLFHDIRNRLIEMGLLEEEEDLMEEVLKDSVRYREMTVEVLALFNWLRRFTEGLIEGEADEN